MEYDITKTSTTALDSGVTDYSVDSKTTDGVYSQKENKWTNDNFTKYYGFYSKIGEYKSAINSFATLVIGQGYTANNATTVMLENITGWGEDTILSILWNMIVVKKFNGDSYAEIMRNDKGTLVNLKTLTPERMAHILNKQGLIERYEYTQYDGRIKKFEPNEILHFCNDRIADEPHGTATTEAVEWLIEALEEARRDWKRIAHRSTVRVLYVEESDKTRLANLRKDYGDAIGHEVLILPGNQKDYGFQDLNLPPVESFLAWIRYLGDQFYNQLGINKAAIGGTQDNTEASAKIGLFSNESVWAREILDVEADLWNQLAVRIKINKQPSMMDGMQQQEQKNQAQTGFQPNDTQVKIRGER